MKTHDSVTVLSLFACALIVVIAGFVFHKPLDGPPEFYLTVHETRDLLNTKPDTIIIDTSRHFYNDGHIPGAVNYTKCALTSVASTFDRDKTYLVYSHATGAPLASAQRLIGAGFKSVYAMRGNYGAWVDAGYPVEN
jgi:rhodanese-related sulfurtransferase